MWSGSLVSKKSPELADIRTKTQRELLRVTVYRTALSFGGGGHKQVLQNISLVTARLNIRAGMCCISAVCGVLLVVSELQRAPGCYSTSYDIKKPFSLCPRT